MRFDVRMSKEPAAHPNPKTDNTLPVTMVTAVTDIQSILFTSHRSGTGENAYVPPKLNRYSKKW